jgi:hypothetical protein
VEQDDPDRVEHRLQQADQTRLDGRDRAEAAGEEDVGDRHLDHAEPDQGERLDGVGGQGDRASGQDDPGPQDDRAGQVGDAAQPDRVEVAQGPQADDRPRVGHAAGQPQRDARPLARAAVAAVEHDRRDPDGRQADPRQRAAVGPLAQQEHPQGDHPEGRRALEEDRVGRRRRLDRRQVEAGHGGEGQDERDHRRPERPPRAGDERHQHQTGEQAAIEGDRQAVELDDLGDDAAEAPEHGRRQDVATPACLRSRMPRRRRSHAVVSPDDSTDRTASPSPPKGARRRVVAFPGAGSMD